MYILFFDIRLGVTMWMMCKRKSNTVILKMFISAFEIQYIMHIFCI